MPPRLRGLGPQCRSISQHVGLSSHHYQQLLLLYKIGSSIDRGQAKFAPVALGHARHGYIYLCRESWLAGGGARVRSGWRGTGVRRASRGVALRRCAALRAAAAARFSAQLWRRPSRHQVAARSCCVCCGVRGRIAWGVLRARGPRNAGRRVPACVRVHVVICSTFSCLQWCSAA